jgi:hypothetical protein
MVRFERWGLERSEPPIGRSRSSPSPGSGARPGARGLGLGREDEARELIEALGEKGIRSVPRDGFFLPTLAVAAEVAARLAAKACAEAIYPALAPFAERHVVFGVGANGYGSTERYLGMLALALGRAGDAVGHRALASNERKGLRPRRLGRLASRRGVPGARRRRARALRGGAEEAEAPA